MFSRYTIYGLCLTLLSACGQHGDRVDLGNIQPGVIASFVRAKGGDWGINISNNNGTIMMQKNPVQIEVFKGEENIHKLVAGYKSVKKEANVFVAKVNVASEAGSKFIVEDRWSISGDVLSLNRKVTVSGTEDSTGFFSAIRLSTPFT